MSFAQDRLWRRRALAERDEVTFSNLLPFIQVALHPSRNRHSDTSTGPCSLSRPFPNITTQLLTFTQDGAGHTTQLLPFAKSPFRHLFWSMFTFSPVSQHNNSTLNVDSRGCWSYNSAVTLRENRHFDTSSAPCSLSLPFPNITTQLLTLTTDGADDTLSCYPSRNRHSDTSTGPCSLSLPFPNITFQL